VSTVQLDSPPDVVVLSSRSSSDSLEQMQPSSCGSYLVVKTIMDIGLGSMLLVLVSPLLILLAFLVKMTSRGPVIYSQMRFGRGQRPYRIFKLRTMRHDCESISGACWSTPGDQRITPLGRFLRTTHLDELPQLWNVVCGNMSLVGPRPERSEFVPGLMQAIPGYEKRLAIRPGITGLAQLRLPPDVDLDSVRRKVIYDLYYIQHLSLWLDIRLLGATALKCLGVGCGIRCLLFGLPRLIGAEGRVPQLPSVSETPRTDALQELASA
jgi:lipopolysaccharide/colanic/teichoic acid biosynthesis glycosyltransferase